jgi:hypothetical protein
MREYMDFLEASSLFENLRRTYRNQRGLTSKFTKGVGCPKRVGNQVPRGPTLLHRLPLGVFPRIELTTSDISLIKLQTRFIDFARMKEINFLTCFVTEKRIGKILGI